MSAKPPQRRRETFVLDEKTTNDMIEANRKVTKIQAMVRGHQSLKKLGVQAETMKSKIE